MAHITWKMADGSEISAEVKDGLNLMEGATANNVPHIEGECGGCLSCALPYHKPYYNIHYTKKDIESRGEKFSR